LAAKKSKKKKGLPQQAPQTPCQVPSNGTHEVPLALIYPNPDQPRKFFPKEALEELAQSIREQGLIEPLVVVLRPRKMTRDEYLEWAGAITRTEWEAWGSRYDEGDNIPNKLYMLVAGERRWRACRMVGLEKVPVRILDANDHQVAEMSLVENLQRQDLTPLEEARAFKEMLDSGYTKEELARKLGFKQVWRIDERLSLLNLSPKFQEALVRGIIGPSQAFEMSRLEDPGDQEMVFQKIQAGELPTYNHIRRFVTALIEARKQAAFFMPPKKEEVELMTMWERILNAVAKLISKSFSPEDCRVLARVCHGNTRANLEKIDLIMKHLNEIKKAMLENAGRQEAIRLTQGGENEIP